MNMVFFLEEMSMKVLLDGILPRILPENVITLTIPHQGKSDLEKSLPMKLRGWNIPDTVFVVVHDQDSNDCITLKQKLTDICTGFGKHVLIRIPCRELESWYWGDIDAISKAFGKDLSYLKQRKKYRDPDRIGNPKQELKKLFPKLGQIDGARRIAPFMNIENNTSHSFQIFIQGIKNLCEKGEVNG